jgi:dolichyl-diphosphooligosaccharide--protein glycosyltransferase
MIDYQLGISGTSKFSAPAAFETEYDVSARTLSQPVFAQTQNGFQRVFSAQNERSMRSLRTRLYQHQGSAIGPESPDSALGSRVVVVDWDMASVEGGQVPVLPENRQPLRAFGNLSQAEAFVREDGSAQVGGVLGEPPVRLDALERYRLVNTSPRNTTIETPASRAFRIIEASRQSQSGGEQVSPTSLRPLQVEPWVKTFERVEGASISGEGPANTTVTAVAQMTVPGGGQNFTYRQVADTGADGQFEMTVPYSTTGYEAFGPENGYTNVSVRATGPYEIGTTPTVNASSYVVTYRGTVDVTEAQVVGSDETPATAELEQVVLSAPEGSASESGAAQEEPSAETPGEDAASVGTDQVGWALPQPTLIAGVRG